MLPDLDGFETCRRLRAERRLGAGASCSRRATRSRTACAGSTAAPTTTSTKPFSLAELLGAAAGAGPARTRSSGRPCSRSATCGSIPPPAQVWRGDDEIELSAREFALLETFMRRPGQVLSQPQLLEAAWDLGYEQRSNVVEVYVRYLREKIDRPFGVESLETVRGIGLPAAQGRRARVSRCPIRLRLTAAFALAMVARAGGGRAVRLRAAAGRPRRERRRGPGRARRGRRRRRGAASAGAAGDAEESFAQVLGAGGELLEHAAGCAAGPEPAELRRARAATACWSSAGCPASRARRACSPVRATVHGRRRRPVARRPRRGARAAWWPRSRSAARWPC